MSTNDTSSHKSNEPPTKEEMVYCGEYELSSATKDVEDNIDGTLTVQEGHRAAAGAKGGDRIWVRVEHNGDETWARRKLHSTGRSVTLPLEARKQIGLKPGDTVRYWIDLADVSREQQTAGGFGGGGGGGDPTPERDTDPYVVDSDESGLTYHVVSEDDRDETVCGIDLADKDVNRFSDPGDVLEICADCNVRASEDMSNREIVDWFAGTIDNFPDPRDTNPSYLTKEQLVALRDNLLELREEVDS